MADVETPTLGIKFAALRLPFAGRVSDIRHMQLKSLPEISGLSGLSRGLAHTGIFSKDNAPEGVLNYLAAVHHEPLFRGAMLTLRW
jgi:hypothetical protein